MSSRLALLGMLLLACGEPKRTPSRIAESPAPAPTSPAPPAAAVIPAGPQPAWTFTFAALPSRLTLAVDGTALALVEDRLVAVRAGAIAWRRDDELRDVLAVVGDAALVARRDPEARRDRLYALALADGRELWSVLLPPDVTDDEYADPIGAAIVAVDGPEVLVGDSVARWFRLAPARCARGTAKRPAADCLVAAGRLPDETLDTDARLSFGTDGRRVLHEFGVVRVFDDRWQTLLTARSHDFLGAAALGPDGLALVIDDDVMLLAVERCDGEDFAPSGWPQPGRLYAPSTDECRDCAAPPAGCRRWRVYLDDVHSEPPALLDGGGIVVHEDGHTVALADGRELWRTHTGGGGRLLRVGEQLFGVSLGLADDDPLALYALGLDGAPAWRAPLPITHSALFYSSDELVLRHADRWLLAGHKATIAAFALPGSVADAALTQP